MDLDDLLGVSSVSDLPGPSKRKKVPRRNGARKYEELKPPKNPSPNGIFALRKKHGNRLGVTCLIDNVQLKHKRGRRPVICRKAECFRAYRNAYRADYDKARA